MRWMQGWMTGMVLATATQVAATPWAWIANLDGESVSRLDLATNESVTIDVGGMPYGVAASPDGQRAYVGNANASTVLVLDGVTMGLLHTVPLVSAARGIATLPDGSKAYAARYDGFVDVIDGATGTLIDSIQVKSDPFGSVTLEGMVINPAGTRVYVGKAENSTSSVAVIDTTTDAFVADILGAHDFSLPLAVNVSSDGTRLFSTASNVTGVRRYDATTNLLIDEIPLTCPSSCSFVQALVPSLDGARLFVGMQGFLAVIDTATGTQVDTLPLTSQFPTGMDLSPDGTRLYVVDGFGQVEIFDSATLARLGAVLTVGAAPVGFGRFIIPGTPPTTSTSSTSSTFTTTTTSSTTTTSTLAPIPVLSTTARSCQTALAGTWKKFPVKVHKLFASCFDRMLRDVASGAGTAGAAASCQNALSPSSPSSSFSRARASARAGALTRCGALAPAQVAHPCSPAAATMDAVVDCVLDRQADRLAAIVAAEYAVPCSIATAAGLATTFPALCAP